tara:strand:- start:2632 stop:3522 length:891 start_codon:yes stop_codon:yes gene_type:complete
MSFTFKDPDEGDNHLLISISSASGGGKTWSAMELATGICGDEPFAVIDTEAGRAKHYRSRFNFKHLDMTPPFTPERYLQAVKAAEKEGFKAIVIDSMSHEYDGEGGLFDIHDASPGQGPGKWKDAKRRHKKMMNGFLQTRSDLIFCLRADEKIDMSQKDDRGKVIITSQGWVPIQEKRFQYEMTLSLTMTPQEPGIVNLQLPHKIQDQHRMSFNPGTHVTAEAGKALAAWARGDDTESPDKELWDKARRVAQDGMAPLKTYFNNVLTDAERLKLKPIGVELNATAKRADANRGEIG